jgi:arginine:pyruvate transaminase
MRFSSLVQRVGGEGADAWKIYYAAVKAKRAGRDVINLCIGDTDFDSPAPAIEATVAALRGGDTHYADIQGRYPLRKAIAEAFAGRTGLATEPGNVIFMAGAQNALFGTCQCLFDKGDEVIAPEPMYVTYEATIRASGADMVTCPSPARSGFHIDLDALAAAVTPRTRGIMFASPNNPTGAVMTRRELEAIAAIAREHDLWVISDEVYATIAFEREHISIASLPGMAERTATVSSLSKSHAMPGWRVGWVIGPRELITHMSTLSLCMTYGLPGFIQEGAVAALKEGDADAERMAKAYRARRDLVHAALSKIQTVRCVKPEGGMFVLFSVEATGMTAEDFAWKLFEETGTAVLPADAFGASARGHLRMSIGVADGVLEEACRRIAAFALKRAAG